MIIKKSLALFMITIYSVTLYAMDIPPMQDPQKLNAANLQAEKELNEVKKAYYLQETSLKQANAANLQAKKDLDDAKNAYYIQEIASRKASDELQQQLNIPLGLTQQEVVKQSVSIAARKVDSALSYATDELRKKYIGLSETEILQKEIEELDKQLKEESLKGQTLANETAEVVKRNKEAESNVLKQQELNHEIDAAEKIGARLPGGHRNPEFKERWDQLKVKAGFKTTEEKPQEKPKPETPKVSFFTKVTTPFVIAFATAGQMADFLASYSFAHLTNLDCFKGTFIATNAREINRFLVATSIVGISYIAYKKYKALHKDEDSFFDNDAEE